MECDRLHAGGARYSLAATTTAIIGRGPERRAYRSVRENVHELRV